jgi:hypothetical protein
MVARILKTLVFLASGALAAPAWAQRVPCFVVPLDAAKASDASGRIEAARLSPDCASVAVQEGRLRVVFASSQGANTQILGPGEKPVLTGARSPGEVYASVGREVGAAVQRSGATPPGKAHDDGATSAVPIGGPAQDVYVPEGGLQFALLSIDQPTEYRVLDAAGKVLQQGSATSGVKLTRQGLVADGKYQFQLLRGGKLWKTSNFALPEAQVDQDVGSALRSLDSRGLDRTSLAIARALVYEMNSLSFNRGLSLRELRP